MRGTTRRHQLLGYATAVLLPLATMLAGARFGMPAFVFEDLTILLVVTCAIRWGIGPAVTAALVATFGDNILLREPIGELSLTGIRDVIDVSLFLAVAGIVAWLVARAQRERRRAEAAVADRDRLIATISHDLGTPLSAIRGTVQMVRRFGASPQIDLNRVLTRLDIAASRVGSLIRMLGDARALDSGDLRLHTAVTDLRECVRPVIEMLERVSDRHPIAAALPEHPVLVEADVERLQRVFENLVSNAIKYSPDGGTVEVSLASEQQAAVVTVRDYGMGISDDALPRLFERSYRAPEAAQAASGLGLGLSISAEIVKRHGGTIKAKRAAPKGSVLTVTLPLAAAAAPRAAGDQPRVAT